MNRLNFISKRVLIILIALLPIIVPGLELKSALLLSIGFGMSVSLWRLSLDLESIN